MTSPRDRAVQAIALLDLTDLTDTCTPDAIVALCERAQTVYGTVAAICIWPRFVRQASSILAGTGVKVATVANFPSGAPGAREAAAEVRDAFADGADEVDVVMPYRAFLAGQEAVARDLILACVDETPSDQTLKVILETGLFPDPEAVGRASRLAIAAGAGFIKTSTGKVSVSATLPAAEAMLAAIAEAGRPVGFKAAGGIRTLADATGYLELAETVMGGNWVSPATFRFGASALLADLLAVAEGRTASAVSGQY